MSNSSKFPFHRLKSVCSGHLYDCNAINGTANATATGVASSCPQGDDSKALATTIAIGAGAERLAASHWRQRLQLNGGSTTVT
jgi:hypothetical protein